MAAAGKGRVGAMAEKRTRPFRFNATQWLCSAEICCLLPEQEGIYIRLLCHCAQADDSAIPSDSRSLALLARVSNQRWRALAPPIVRLFEEAPGRPGFIVPRLMPWLDRDEPCRYVPRTVRQAILERDRACRWCGTTDGLEIDHIFPVALGGDSTIDNLQALCGPCNRSKGARVH